MKFIHSLPLFAQVEFVSRDSRQLFFDALQRTGSSDGSNRRYEPSSPRSRGRGGGYYDNRWDRGRGGRGSMRRDMSNHRPWHRGEYDYADSREGYQQRGSSRYRGPYEGGGYESADDYDQELRDYNYSRQREREKEQGRHRHDRGGRDRDREEASYSGSERYFPEGHEGWRDDRSSSGSYEDSRDRKEPRPPDFPEEHDRERYSADEDRASIHGKPPSRDVGQDEKGAKRKEKKKRRPRSPSPEDERVEEKEMLSVGEDVINEKRAFDQKKKKERVADTKLAVKSKDGEHEVDREHLENNGTKSEDLPAQERSDQMPAPASPPPPTKVSKKKEKKEKRKRHKRIFSLSEEEEEREVEEKAARLEEAAIRGGGDLTASGIKQRAHSDADLQRLEKRDIHSAPESSRLDQADLKEKPRRHSADERLPKEEREMSREAGGRSPRNKTHRDERRRDWENKDVTKPKRRRTSNSESPPPPPPPPPPREAGEAFPAQVDVLPRVVPPQSDGHNTQVIRPPYDVAPAPGHYESQVYDANRGVPVGASPATLSPIPPVGITLNPAVAGPPPGSIGTPPLAVHSPSVPMGSAPLPALASPQGAVPPPPPPHSEYNSTPPIPQPSNTDTLLDLLRRYPVVWQGLLALKNDSAAVQMHYLAGNGHLAEVSLPQAPANGIGSVPPPIRIAQRMRLEPSQLEGVIRRMQVGANLSRRSILSFGTVLSVCITQQAAAVLVRYRVGKMPY